MNKLDGYQKIDYALFIRPDLFSNEFIEAVKQKVVHTICAYQWDGMDRFPEVWRTVDLFDKFFVFDKNDLAKSPQLMLTNNFFILIIIWINLNRYLIMPIFWAHMSMVENK